MRWWKLLKSPLYSICFLEKQIRKSSPRNCQFIIGRSGFLIRREILSEPVRNLYEVAWNLGNCFSRLVRRSTEFDSVQLSFFIELENSWQQNVLSESCQKKMDIKTEQTHKTLENKWCPHQELNLNPRFRNPNWIFRDGARTQTKAASIKAKTAFGKKQ
jgi:hypothetical protein